MLLLYNQLKVTVELAVPWSVTNEHLFAKYAALCLSNLQTTNFTNYEHRTQPRHTVSPLCPGRKFVANFHLSRKCKYNYIRYLARHYYSSHIPT